MFRADMAMFKVSIALYSVQLESTMAVIHCPLPCECITYIFHYTQFSVLSFVLQCDHTLAMQILTHEWHKVAEDTKTSV